MKNFFRGLVCAGILALSTFFASAVPPSTTTVFSGTITNGQSLTNFFYFLTSPQFDGFHRVGIWATYTSTNAGNFGSNNTLSIDFSPGNNSGRGYTNPAAPQFSIVTNINPSVSVTNITSQSTNFIVSQVVSNQFATNITIVPSSTNTVVTNQATNIVVVVNTYNPFTYTLQTNITVAGTNTVITPSVTNYFIFNATSNGVPILTYVTNAFVTPQSTNIVTTPSYTNSGPVTIPYPANLLFTTTKPFTWSFPCTGNTNGVYYTNLDASYVDSVGAIRGSLFNTLSTNIAGFQLQLDVVVTPGN